jgi:hypothetical protein
VKRFICNEFHSFSDLICVVENMVGVSFGVAAITLWEAVRETTGFHQRDSAPKKPHKTEESEELKKNRLAGLCYMIRCCFAHGTALPVWRIENEKYKTIYQIGNKEIDLRKIDKEPFDYSHIGGMETLRFLRDECLKLGML